MKKNTPLVLFAVVIILVIVAFLCQVTGAGAPQGQPSVPGAATSMTAPSRKYLSLGSAVISQSGKAPDFTITVETPVMNGSQDPHVVAFNQAVSQVVQKQVEAFKTSLKGASTQPVSTGSSFNLRYVPVSQTGQIVSLQLKIEQQIDGTAHPSDYIVAFTYDLNQEKEITLDQLFTPGAKYLQAISDYCKAELGKRNIGFDAQQHGADPLAENYRSWNISPDSLVISFDPSQVAPYSAGPQIVFIPYSVLKSLIDPKGPLAQYNP